jgi:TolB-like protein/tetratricopeptide (TPR) repeat protein
MNLLIIGLLVMALTVSVTFNVTGIRHTEKSAEGNWIAVLPFTNISSNPESAALVDGIHNDLLTRLANNKALKVISQTSVMEYRNTTKSIPQIGEELDVDTILEGTVQQAGDTVRFNMQLIDARTDEHLWAKIYDRNLTMQDIFEIQTDISAEIARELRAALTTEDQGRIARIPTDNLVAYSLYSKAQADMATRQRDDALAARRQFEQAIELDPDFAEAHAGLATSVLLLFINSQAIERDEAIAIAERELDIALSLNPDLADAYATLGLLKMQIWQISRTGDENIEAAAAFNKALELNPNHAYAYMWFASLRDTQGQIDEAIALYEKSKEIDPLGRIPYANLPGLYAQRGQNEESLRQLIQATELHPDWSTPYEFISLQLAALGRIDEALAWLYRARELTSDSFEGGNVDVGIYMTFGDTERAKETIASFPDTHPIHDYAEALNLLIDRDVQPALRMIVDLVEQKANQPTFIYGIVSNIALLADDLETAKEYTLRSNPVLTSDTDLVVDRFTIGSVIQLAYIAKRQGETQKAHDMLAMAMTYVQSLPRLGIGGHGIADVQIYALQGRVEDAISAFRDAVDEGYRSAVMYDFWMVQDDPYLASIRDDERFVALLASIESDVERMRDNASRAEESDDWNLLRQIVIQAAKSDVVARLPAT